MGIIKQEMGLGCVGIVAGWEEKTSVRSYFLRGDQEKVRGWHLRKCVPSPGHLEELIKSMRYKKFLEVEGGLVCLSGRREATVDRMEVRKRK